MWAELQLAEARTRMDLPALARGDSVLIRDTRLSNIFTCQPQQKNSATSQRPPTLIVPQPAELPHLKIAPPLIWLCILHPLQLALVRLPLTTYDCAVSTMADEAQCAVSNTKES